jgi:soluble cytochrome b562
VKRVVNLQRAESEDKTSSSVAKPSNSDHKHDHSVVVSRVCHLLVLSREGKVQDAVASLVLAVLAADPSLTCRTPAGFAEAIDAYFSVRIDEDLLGDAIQGHFDAGRLVVGNVAGDYALSPSTKADVEGRIVEAAALESQVRDEWLAAVRDECGITEPGQLAELWRALRAYLAKAFLRHGAETAVLLDARLAGVDPVGGSLSAFQDEVINSYCPDIPADKVKTALIRFFSTTSPARTRYLAHLLDGTFTVFALSVDEATARYLRSNLQPLRLFLDTNFIFGLLDLHTNPFAEASRELVHLLRESNFPFKLYYHGATLREIENTLESIGERLKAQRWRQAMSRAVVRSGALTGVERRFHEKNAVQPIDAELFMARFADVQGLLKQYGALVWRPSEKVDPQKDEEKWLQIADYKEFLEKRRPDRPKPYEAMNHDVVVWRDVELLRSKGKSILEAGALFLSADYSLYQWVWRRRRSKADIGSVVLPSQFLQLLRPFVASTDDIDRRFVEVFAVPEMRAYPIDYSATVNEILKVINTVSDMQEDAALRLLTDTILLDELRGVKDHTKVTAEIELAIARQNHELLEEKEAALREAQEARSQKERLASQLTDRDRQVQELWTGHQEVVGQLEGAEKKVAEVTESASTRIAELEQRVREAQTARQRLEQRTRALRATVGVAVWALGIILIAVLPTSVVHWNWLDNHPDRLSLIALTGLIWSGICWAIFDRDHRWVAAAVAVISGLVGLAALLGH